MCFKLGNKGRINHKVASKERSSLWYNLQVEKKEADPVTYGRVRNIAMDLVWDKERCWDFLAADASSGWLLMQGYYQRASCLASIKVGPNLIFICQIGTLYKKPTSRSTITHITFPFLFYFMENFMFCLQFHY